ncbi:MULTISPECIES: siderophore-interacting protein [Sphingobacterium]|uniref:Siderophore-interacting protein n=1 Tax=Sphingobacterium hotanense TaxID=649196 RepID=A0ABT7NMQ3_9SPHI|nr:MULTISPECIES: siderophore-interacting protein [Sphingobacterium]MDM1048522.1 siderophore-interacting protein [Sphingobacterium hotanense]
MPRVPQWMADAMEKFFSGSYHASRVTEIEYLAPELKYIRFEGDFSGVKTDFVAGNVIEIRVNATEFRHYTSSYFNREQGVCDILFYLHDKGPGSRWAEKLRVGDPVKLLGPGRKMSFVKYASAHVVIGDETAIGLMQSINNASKMKARPCFCFIDIQQKHNSWLEWINLEDCSYRTVNMRALEDSFRQYVEWIDNNDILPSYIAFYLSGNTATIQLFRKELIRKGYSNKQIQTYPYWAEGKIGL